MNYRRVNKRCTADFCSCKVGISALHGGQTRRHWPEANVSPENARKLLGLRPRPAGQPVGCSLARLESQIFASIIWACIQIDKDIYLDARVIVTRRPSSFG